MEEKKYPEGWIVVDHIIPGVTAEMIDWWWVNMEKGYELWCPDEHKGFRWEVKPPLGGHIGAVQIATESIDYGPVMDLRIEWVDPNLGTQEQKDFWTYEHLLPPGPPEHSQELNPLSCFLTSMKPFPAGARCVPACIEGWTASRARPPAGGRPPSRLIRKICLQRQETLRRWLADTQYL